MTEYIIFTNRKTGKEYAAITLEGATRDEVKATRELLAYENGLEKNEITYALEER